MVNLIWFKMHFKNLLNKKNSLVFFIGFFIFISCNTNNNENKKNYGNKYNDLSQIKFDKRSNSDSIIYSLSDEAENAIDFLIGKDIINIAGFCCDQSENEFTFSFVNNENRVYSARKAQFILQNSNRYLKTKRHILKVFSMFDDFFLDYPKDSIRYFYHYQSFGVIVNAKGELVREFSEKYK
jgi:hypothetical protein